MFSYDCFRISFFFCFDDTNRKEKETEKILANCIIIKIKVTRKQYTHAHTHTHLPRINSVWPENLYFDNDDDE